MINNDIKKIIIIMKFQEHEVIIDLVLILIKIG